jgi:uncharacterized cupin superfamily protein
LSPGIFSGGTPTLPEETHYIIAGTGELHMEDGSTYRVSPGSIFAIPTPVKHTSSISARGTLPPLLSSRLRFTQNVMMPPKSHILGTPNRES